MTWTISWHDDTERILILKPVAAYTWAEFNKMIDNASMMVARKSYPVDVIYDLTEHIPLPGPGLLVQEREVHYRTPDNIGQTVLVGAREYTRTVTKTVYKSLRDETDLAFTDTLEQAITLLDQEEEE